MRDWLSIAAAALLASACASTPESPTVKPETVAGPASVVPASPNFEPDEALEVCQRMNVHNAPITDEADFIVGYAPFVRLNGVVLAVAPTPGVCLSSGFGPRNERFHKGLDFRTDMPGEVYAAGAGTVREAGYRDDYGFNVIIDHGNDVFTRYAHLVRLADGIEVGAIVPFGTPLGPMGNSSKYRLPVHLHYEILSGDFDTPKQSFGLDPVDPFSIEYVK